MNGFAVMVCTGDVASNSLLSLLRRVCDGVMNLWSKHRPNASAWYSRTNFGEIHVHWPAEGGAPCPLLVDAHVRDASGRVVLHVQRDACEPNPIANGTATNLDASPLDAFVIVAFLWSVGAVHLVKFMHVSDS